MRTPERFRHVRNLDNSYLDSIEYVFYHKGISDWLEQLGEITVAKTMITAELGKQEIVITRVFDAPPAGVQDLPGSKSCTRVVGTEKTYDYCGQDGGETRRCMAYRPERCGWQRVRLHGVYHEIVPPERLSYTFEFEGMPGYILLETVTLEEQEVRRR